MELAEAIADLQAHRSDQIATIYSRRNPGVATWGVRFGDLDTLAKRIKADSEMAFALWDMKVLEPRILALKILDPVDLDERRIDTWVEEIDFPILADMLAGLVYWTPFADSRRAAWTESRREFIRRAGFSLVYVAASDPANPISDDELRAYLGQVERETHASANWGREMMNMVPVAIGKRDDALLPDAVATARALGQVDVFHGDKTNCKVINALDRLHDPRTTVKPPKLPHRR